MKLIQLILLLTAVQAQLFRKNSPVKETKKARFTQDVLYSPHVSFVMFYAPWCGHCQSAAPEIEKAAVQLKDIANVLSVDCTMKSNQELCKKYGAKGYPHFKVFQPGQLTETDYKKVENGGKFPLKRPERWNYNSAREAQSIVPFVTSKINGFYKTLNTTTIDKFIDSNEHKLILLQGTKSKTVPNYFKVLTRDFFGHVRFGVLPRTTIKSWSKLNLPVSEKASLIFVNADGERKKFKGKPEKKEIMQFINAQLNANKKEEL